MDPRFLLNLVVGALALLGWAVLIIFLIEFRREVTTHPIYRMPDGPANLRQTTKRGIEQRPDGSPTKRN